MYCDECGVKNRDQAKFCRTCGSPFGRNGVSPGDSPTLSLQTRAPLVPLGTQPLSARYDILERLGGGGMGVVYQARDPILDRPVAIKVLRRSLADNPDFVRRFLREARIAARLRHPNIVSIHEVGESDRGYYYVMDFIDGETLAEFVGRRGPLLVSDATRILLQICRAVSFAHDEQVLHRDLKPENVMIDQFGGVVVMDFGLARAADDPGLTAAGSLLGSPRYMSPEQIEGAPLDLRTDVFSVGLVFYFLLAGRALFDGDTTAAVLEQHRTLSIESAIDDLRATIDLPELPLGLLRQMLARRPSRRLADLRLTVRHPQLQAIL